MFHRSRVPDWLAALSLANLIFLRCWAELLGPEQTRIYWLKNTPAPVHYRFADASTSSCWARSFTLLMGGLRRKSRIATRILLVSGLLILVSLVNSLRTMLANPGTSLFLRFVEQRAPVIGVAFAIVLVGALVFGGIRALRPVYKLLLVVSPFLLFTFGQSVYRIATYQEEPSMTARWRLGCPPNPPGAPRVIWVIFDEWDEELTFAERPSRIHLPEIDRLRADGFSATRPSGPTCSPIGRCPRSPPESRWNIFIPDGPNELMIMPHGAATTHVRWSEQDTVFRAARKWVSTPPWWPGPSHIAGC